MKIPFLMRWMRDLSCAFGRISNANAYIENARVYIEMPQGIISIRSPLITAYAELPHPVGGGSLLFRDASKYSAFPWGSLTVAEGNFDHPVNGQKVNERAARSAPGQGTDGASRWWMRDDSDKCGLPDSVTLMLHRRFARLARVLKAFVRFGPLP